MDLPPPPILPVVAGPAPRLDAPQGQQDAAQQLEALRRSSRALEASFLAEMLRHAGLGQTPEGFGGGAGEDQFSSYMTRLQAEQIAEQGGIGLAEHIFEALKRQVGGDG